MSNLCAYSDIFGKPGQGAHSYRLFNIAVVDVVLTFALAMFFQRPIQVFVLLMLLSIIIHKAFCVPTTLTKLVFTEKSIISDNKKDTNHTVCGSEI